MQCSQVDNTPSKDDILTKKLKRYSIVWIAFMCIGLILSLGDFSIRFYCGFGVSLLIWGGSLIIAKLDFAEERHVFLGKLCILLCVVFTLIAPIFFKPHVIRNPFTSEQFASKTNTNFFNRGTITYYRKWGPILYSPQRSEPTQILSSDSNFVYIDKDHIYVDSTFYGFGANYEISNDAIDLRGGSVETWHISHKNYFRYESFTLSDESPNVLRYSNSDGTEKSVSLNDMEYKNLIGILQKMPLAIQPTTRNENTFYYELTVDLYNDDAGYYATVDGNEVFSVMESYFE